LHTIFLFWAICGRFGAGFLPDITVLKIISNSKPNLFLEYQGRILIESKLDEALSVFFVNRYWFVSIHERAYILAMIDI